MFLRSVLHFDSERLAEPASDERHKDTCIIVRKVKLTDRKEKEGEQPFVVGMCKSTYPPDYGKFLSFKKTINILKQLLIQGCRVIGLGSGNVTVHVTSKRFEVIDF